MIRSSEQLTALEALAVGAARRAGEMIRAEFGKQREVMAKQGGSSLASQVVTAVDLESQRLILDVLGPSMSELNLGLLTEECVDDESRHRCDGFWCVDPLDGTLPFIDGTAGFSVSIALVSREGLPWIGVVFDPLTGTLYQAVRGRGAMRNGETWDIGASAPEAVLTWVMDRSMALQPGYASLREKIELLAASAGLNGVRIVDHGGAAMNACWVVEHAPAVYFKFPKPEKGGGSLWDYAATACIFHELGIPATDIHDAPLRLNRRDSTFMNQDGIVYASDGSLGAAVRGLDRQD